MNGLNSRGHVDEMKEVLKQPESVMELETELENSLNLLSEFQIRKANLQIEIQKTATAIALLLKINWLIYPKKLK